MAIGEKNPHAANGLARAMAVEVSGGFIEDRAKNTATMRRWFVLAVVALVVGAVLAFLAIGTAHRDSCALTTSSLSGCNLLPWSGSLASEGSGPVLP